MRRVIWIFVVAILITYKAFASEQLPLMSPESKENNEYGIQCAAIFAIFAELYAGEKDIEKSNYYERKFQKKYADEEAKFVASKGDKEEFNDYVQKHVDSLAIIAPEHPSTIIAFKERCDQLFP